MKKEYVKPTLLVLTTEPSQIMVGSPGSVVPGVDTNGDGVIDEKDDIGYDDGEDGEGLPPVCTKGGLWDEYTW